MHGLHIEERHPKSDTLLPWDLAHHMYGRCAQGQVAVVAKEPAKLVQATEKQWMKTARQMQHERATTDDVARIIELARQISYIQCIKFSAEPPDDLLEDDVTFATAEDFLKAPPACPTLYITHELAREQLHMLASWMPTQSLVVLYH